MADVAAVMDQAMGAVEVRESDAAGLAHGWDPRRWHRRGPDGGCPPPKRGDVHQHNAADKKEIPRRRKATFGRRSPWASRLGRMRLNRPCRPVDRTSVLMSG